MKTYIIATLILATASFFPAHASYRDHKHFTPKEVGAITAELIATLTQLKADYPEAVFGRAILTKGAGVGIGVRLSLEKNGQIELVFDLAVERKRNVYISSSQDGIDDRRTLVFRPTTDPELKWHLGEVALLNLEKKLSAPASRMWDYELYHEVLLSESSGEILQSSSRVTAKVWTVEDAVELVVTYYSHHPKELQLWEDG